MDLLLACVLTVLVVVTVASTIAPPDRLCACVIGALTVAPVALRQLAPVLTMVVILLALLAYSLLGYGEFIHGGFGVVIAMFTVAVLRSRVVAAAMWALTTLVSTIMFIHSEYHVAWSEAVQVPLGVLVAAWIGEITKRWAQRSERLAGEMARAVAGERGRIARELHDVVAHHMSVISVQAGLAEYVLDTDLPTARNAISAVGGSSREALAELRRLLDVLRAGEGDAAEDYQPQPGLGSLDELVRRMRGAGVPVDVVVTGRPRRLSPGADLCAYRVAQESLTNVLKHAGPATARIELDYGERLLTLKISDTGDSPSTVKSPSTSHGITGMRERAALYGGVLTAGPLAGQGFDVTLRLPIGDASP